MSRRFVPPAVAAFGGGPDADLARTVAQARDEGFAEGRDSGFQAGHAAGMRDGEAAAAAAYQTELAALQEKFAKQQATLAVTEALDRLLAARAEDRAALEDDTRAAILTALRVLFPTLLEQAAGGEIAALLAEALTERAPEALTLRANPATLRSVATHDLPGDHANRLTMQDVPAMAVGAAEIAWCGGGLTFDPAALHERVLRILAPDEKEPSA